MGVPKFFRWLSERYPTINQRYGSPPAESTCLEHFGKAPPDYLPSPDPLSTCGLPPQIDRLYIDMNGILHGCSHNNNKTDDDLEEGANRITEEEIFRNVCYYLDRIIKDIAKPNELVYMAIDGVAPRAKLNQQRARRYRSGKEGEIERTVYDAHLEALERQRKLESEDEIVNGDHELSSGKPYEHLPKQEKTLSQVLEFEPGRFSGKFETKGEDSEPPSNIPSDDGKQIFHSNSITPGTPFFMRCTQHIEQFIQHKISTDPDWQNLTIIFSGPNVPGEGEHKIMQFMREQRCQDGYNPNLRHCIMGQDGDLIMLGLVTHEPNLVLLREQVLFDKKRSEVDHLLASCGLDVYIHNANFEFLHMNVLRDYLAYEFETSNILPDSPYDMERTIDDFVFLTFFVGNDFLPHMPALDIADEAFDLLFYTYRDQRKKWLRSKKEEEPYLTDSGNIVSGRRLESFLRVVGAHEGSYYDYKKSTEDLPLRRKIEARFGMRNTPSDDLLASKEESDRARFRQMLQNTTEEDAETLTGRSGFKPAMSSEKISSFQPSGDEVLDRGLFDRMGSLLEHSVSSEGENSGSGSVDDQDLKGRYYADKFGFSPFDAEKHLALRKAYVEGLVWNLKYYYEGCVSWEWYYPYHYGPMISDLVGLNNMLDEISFEGKMGAPLKPFEQLMACMPPSHSELLPEPYRWLMTDQSSPIREFYPQSFTVDMNGKRWPWEAVVLLPFIDSGRLLEVSRGVDESMLTEEERERNKLGETVVISRDSSIRQELPAVGEGGQLGPLENSSVSIVPFNSSTLIYQQTETALFKPMLLSGVEVPLPGLPTLRKGCVQSMWRKQIRVNVHGSPSRYKTAVLELTSTMPELLPTSTVASHLIGTTIYINYPCLIEGFVTAVSDSKVIYRGESRVTPWNGREEVLRKKRLRKVVKSYVFGQKLTGTGGLALAAGDTKMEELDILLHVRPLKGLKTMPDGSTVKCFAKFEVEVPLFVTSWAPISEDTRLQGLPALLEKDPYNAAKRLFACDSPEEDASAGNTNCRKPTPLRDLRPGGMPSERKLNKSNLGQAPLVGMGLLQGISMEGEPNQNSADQASVTGLGLLEGLPSQSRGFKTLSGSDRRTRVFSTLSAPTSNQAGLPVPSIGQNISSVGRFAPVLPSTTSLRQSGSPVVASRSRGSPRGRLITIGLVAALSFFSTAAAHDVRHQSPTHMRPDLASSPTTEFRRVPEEDRFGFHEEKHLPPLEFAHGTTTLSFTFQGGIVAAVDSRASLGSFVGSKTTQKVLPINNHMLATMAGGAADCMIWIRKLRSAAALHELAEGCRMSVARASRLLSNALYENRALGLSVGTMVMGYDDTKGSPPRIYYVDNSGTRIEGDLFAVGSGSTFALGILDTERRHDMSVNEAVALGIKAIRHATYRDAYSGGFINVYLITPDGWQRVFSEDLARSSEHSKQ